MVCTIRPKEVECTGSFAYAMWAPPRKMFFSLNDRLPFLFENFLMQNIAICFHDRLLLMPSTMEMLKFTLSWKQEELKFRYNFVLFWLWEGMFLFWNNSLILSNFSPNLHFQKIRKTPMVVSNPQEVPEYEINPLELQLRRADGIVKACHLFSTL